MANITFNAPSQSITAMTPGHRIETLLHIDARAKITGVTYTYRVQTYFNGAAGPLSNESQVAIVPISVNVSAGASSASSNTTPQPSLLIDRNISFVGAVTLANAQSNNPAVTASRNISFVTPLLTSAALSLQPSVNIISGTDVNIAGQPPSTTFSSNLAPSIRISINATAQASISSSTNLFPVVSISSSSSPALLVSTAAQIDPAVSVSTSISTQISSASFDNSPINVAISATINAPLSSAAATVAIPVVNISTLVQHNIFVATANNIPGVVSTGSSMTIPLSLAQATITNPTLFISRGTTINAGVSTASAVFPGATTITERNVNISALASLNVLNTENVTISISTQVVPPTMTISSQHIIPSIALGTTQAALLSTALTADRAPVVFISAEISASSGDILFIGNNPSLSVGVSQSALSSSSQYAGITPIVFLIKDIVTTSVTALVSNTIHNPQTATTRNVSFTANLAEASFGFTYPSPSISEILSADVSLAVAQSLAPAILATSTVFINSQSSALFLGLNQPTVVTTRSSISAAQLSLSSAESIAPDVQTTENREIMPAVSFATAAGNTVQTFVSTNINIYYQASTAVIDSLQPMISVSSFSFAPLSLSFSLASQPTAGGVTNAYLIASVSRSDSSAQLAELITSRSAHINSSVSTAQSAQLGSFLFTSSNAHITGALSQVIADSKGPFASISSTTFASSSAAQSSVPQVTIGTSTGVTFHASSSLVRASAHLAHFSPIVTAQRNISVTPIVQHSTHTYREASVFANTNTQIFPVVQRANHSALTPQNSTGASFHAPRSSAQSVHRVSAVLAARNINMIAPLQIAIANISPATKVSSHIAAVASSSLVTNIANGALALVVRNIVVSAGISQSSFYARAPALTTTSEVEIRAATIETTTTIYDPNTWANSNTYIEVLNLEVNHQANTIFISISVENLRSGPDGLVTSMALSANFTDLELYVQRIIVDLCSQHKFDMYSQTKIKRKITALEVQRLKSKAQKQSKHIGEVSTAQHFKLRAK